ncbi:hypothetical protein BST81_21780 [Leptolyngbya sp. 'hensonii']|nr:hypothetical protein BST81_21780 [Leptolyngbya sp. 'hensonii']
MPSTRFSPSTKQTSQKILEGRYQLLQRLARRLRRQTFLARDLQTQALVVIKVLSFNGELHWNELQAFEQEATTLQRLSHPAIPRYQDHFEVQLRHGDRGLAIVQDYVAGPSLQHFVDAGRIFTEAEAKQIARSILKILTYLHALDAPIIHRDITPDNILMTEPAKDQGTIGQLYLIDFGSVEVYAHDESSSSASTLGTYGFMPPEQFSGRVLAASDLYSLGMTLITLLTGSHPSKLPHKNLSTRFEEVAILSPAFTDWLKWMTEPLVEHRPVSALAALEALESGQQRQLKPKVIHPRPQGSNLVLHKSPACLEVMVPPAGFTPIVKIFALATGGLLLLCSLWTLLALNQSIGIKLLALSLGLPVWAIGLGLLPILLFMTMGRTRLRLNQDQISLVYEIFRFKINRPPAAPMAHISGIRLIQPGHGNETKKPTRLVIQARNRRYELGSNPLFNLVSHLRLTNNPSGFSTLTNPELEWLAHELSNWLGLPISHI